MCVYQTYFSFVWRSVRRLGIPAGLVDDFTQEVFIVAHKRLADFEGRSSLKTWLFGIVVNIVRAHRREVGAGGTPPAPEPAEADEAALLLETSAAPDETTLRGEATAIVDGLLEQMSDEKREVFVLSELEQLSVPEIAVALGIPLNTAYSRLRLARKAFADAAARYRAREEGRLR